VSDGPVILEEIWSRITALEGEFLRTHRQLLFTYRIEGEALLPSHTELRIPRADFERVVPMLPLSDPRKIAKFVTGYPYVAAILSDARISRGAW